MKKLIEINNLKTSFYIKNELIPVIEDVNLHINSSEIVALVGESGSGKSVTALSILNAIDKNLGKIESGEILFLGKNILNMSRKELQKMRGKDISMIFQEPMTALNPVYTIGNQLQEIFRIHEKCSKKESKEKALEMLNVVGVSSPKDRLTQYPHEMSGGIRQRVMIAMALACKPKLIIADEPTTALDVTLQLQILSLMKEINKNFETSILLITHDLGVVANMANRVIVMYAGQIVEEGSVEKIFNNPAHPYTEGLLKSVNSLIQEDEILESIRGIVPNPVEFSQGCRFFGRCSYAESKCNEIKPKLVSNKNGKHACWKSGLKCDLKEYSI